MVLGAGNRARPRVHLVQCLALVLVSASVAWALAVEQVAEAIRKRPTGISESPGRKSGHDQDDGYELMVPDDELLGLDPFSYLHHFGYSNITEGLSETELDERLDKAVRLFQLFAGIPKSGELDDKSIELMRRSRCGNGDIERLDKIKENTRLGFVVNAKLFKLAQNNLTYRIVDYPTKFRRNGRGKVNRIFRWAFGIWSQVVPLSFRRKPDKTGPVDMEIKFVKVPDGSCERCKLFTRSNLILAHSQYPIEGSGMHFNDLVDWSLEGGYAPQTSDGAEKLLLAAVHQIGHALGLAHGQIAKSRMYPMVDGSQKWPLTSHDIKGAQFIYGKALREQN